MGLTRNAVGKAAIDRGDLIGSRRPGEKLIALAGNPNVGKSTIFNALTGLNQHTGNWPGKTVSSAAGRFDTGQHKCLLVDIPGTYSLLARSAEEDVARSFLCNGGADAVIVVCDATCLERNLNLVLQILELTPRVVLCINLLDEAARKHISIDLAGLAEMLGVPVAGTSLVSPDGLQKLAQALDCVLAAEDIEPLCPVRYAAAIERELALLQAAGHSRWLAVQLLLGYGAADEAEAAVAAARARLAAEGLAGEALEDAVVAGLIRRAEEISRRVVKLPEHIAAHWEERLDRLLTSRWFGYPLMVLLLLGVLWLTICGAGYPSRWLEDIFAAGGDVLAGALQGLGTPVWLCSLLVDGIYQVLTWVIAVMLPPMAIFFPLFTLLEDAGYLPRVAYNLDRPFHKCHSCGKQALTMCMGFGCNAAGVVGCRIIDAPRERLLAVLTNSFVPCNGRFSALIAVITMFFCIFERSVLNSAVAAVGLLLVILLGIGMSFIVTRLLSATLLQGEAAPFALELPPYRRPRIIGVLVRSMLDRTLFVLGRAMLVAAPAGLLIWVLANVSIGGASLLSLLAGWLDPLGGILGLDGMILLAFILGLPANEIVLPVLLMGYMAEGTLQDTAALSDIHQLLLANGWTLLTAVCFLVFMLFHWPCSTTLLTIRKETGSWRWAALAAVLPAGIGLGMCMLLNLAMQLLA